MFRIFYFVYLFLLLLVEEEPEQHPQKEVYEEGGAVLALFFKMMHYVNYVDGEFHKTPDTDIIQWEGHGEWRGNFNRN